MFKSWYIVSLVAGLASALTFAAAGVPTFAAAAVFLIAPFPLMIAGLSNGWVVAAAGGLVGAGALTFVLGWSFALPYLCSIMLPAVIVTRLALFSRTSTTLPPGDDAVPASDMEWYPEGRILLTIAVMAALLATGMVLAAGPDVQSFRAATDALLDRVLAIEAGGTVTAEQRQRLDGIKSLFASLLPAAAAMGWTITTYVNFRLAETAAARLRMTARPLPRFGTLTFPGLAVGGLIVAGLSALLPDTIGLIGGAFAGSLAAAFAIMGLAVLHGLLEGHPARFMLLVALYVAVMLLGFALALPLIATGILDMALKMRARSNIQGGSV